MAAKTDFFKIGQISGRQPVDVVGAVQKGISTGLQPFFEWQKKEKAWKESIAPKLAKIGEDYNPSLVDESQRSAMTAALQQSRLKYADILKQVRNMDPTSEEYISLMGQATDIVAGFDTTFKNGQEFSKLGNEYALAAQKPDGLNRGMAVEKRAALGKIFIDKDYTIERNPVTGEMSYIINSDAVGKDGTTVSIKGLKISQDELDDFKLPNQDSVNKYLAQNEVFSGLGKQGEKLTTESAKYKSAAFQLQTELNNLDIEDLRSLALDPFIQGMPAAILDQNSLENIYDLTKEELAGKLQEGMLANLLATNQRDYKAPTPVGAKLTFAQQAALEENKAIKNRLDNAFIGAFNAFSQGKLKGGVFENIKTLLGNQVDIAPVDLERGIFTIKYKSAPTDPDFVSATINLNTEDSLRTLYDLAGLRENVDYKGLPISISSTGESIGPPTEEQYRTESINEDFFTQ